MPTILLVAILVGGLSARAADATAPGTLACSFTAGTSGSYEAGKFSTQAPAPIGFSILDIDLDKQSAALDVGSGVKGKLAVARAVGANHFLEIATEGYWNITTVYDRDPATGRHPAVHSRHLGVVGAPVFALYTGTCEGK
jgi:hypothetical protein